MKFRWNKKYLYWGLTGFAVIICSMIFYDFMFSNSSIKAFFVKSATIIMPIIYGLVIAYLLTPIISWMEHSIFIPICQRMEWELDKKCKKRMRGLSILITVLLFLGAIYGLCVMIIPQLINSLTNIVILFPTYEKNLESLITKILADNPQIESLVNNMLNEYSGELTNWMNTKLIPQLNVILREVSVSVFGIIKVLWNLIIGIIISIYVLGSKELFAAQSKKIIYAFMDEKNGNQFIQDCRFVNKTFGGYISAKLLDSLIIGILCFIGMTILNLPYAVLISVIVGVTNIIPFFGPYIGAIPSTLLILMVNPMQALYFAIFVLLLQQFDGNFLGPKILGNSTGLSSFWVIFSITLLGGYYGIVGMAIGVPVFAVLYAMVRRWVNGALKKKGLSADTEEYMNLSEIKNNEYQELLPPKEKERRRLRVKKQLDLEKTESTEEKKTEKSEK